MAFVIYQQTTAKLKIMSEKRLNTTTFREEEGFREIILYMYSKGWKGDLSNRQFLKEVYMNIYKQEVCKSTCTCVIL